MRDKLLNVQFLQPDQLVPHCPHHLFSCSPLTCAEVSQTAQCTIFAAGSACPALSSSPLLLCRRQHVSNHPRPHYPHSRHHSHSRQASARPLSFPPLPHSPRQAACHPHSEPAAPVLEPRQTPISGRWSC